MGYPGETAGVVASMGHGFLGYSHRGFPGLMPEAAGVWVRVLGHFMLGMYCYDCWSYGRHSVPILGHSV